MQLFTTEMLCDVDYKLLLDKLLQDCTAFRGELQRCPLRTISCKCGSDARHPAGFTQHVTFAGNILITVLMSVFANSTLFKVVCTL